MGITTISLDLDKDQQDVSSLSGDTQSTQFFPQRVQPIAGEAIADKRVVYLELHHILNSVMNTKSSSLFNLVAKYVLNLKYTALSTYEKFKLVQDILMRINPLEGKSYYTLDHVIYRAALQCLITCISNVKEVYVIRQRTLAANLEETSDMYLTWISLRAAIRTTIEVISDLLPVDMMLMREGKLIIRILSEYLDDLTKNFGRIVIKEDPYI